MKEIILSWLSYSLSFFLFFAFADVYERLIQKGKKPGFFQLLATQTVSAVWHVSVVFSFWWAEMQIVCLNESLVQVLQYIACFYVFPIVMVAFNIGVFSL